MKAIGKIRLLCLAGILIILSVLAGGCAAEDGKAKDDGSGIYTSLAELSGKRIGVQMGSIFDEVILDRVPDAEILYYNSFPDEVTALEANKIDGLPTLKMIFSQFQQETHAKYAMIDEPIYSVPLAYLFPKNEDGLHLQKQMDEFLIGLGKSGELGELQEKWQEADEADRVIEDYRSLPDINGTLTFVTEGTFPPFNYVRDGMVVGYDVDVAALFCKAYGYALQVQTMTFDALMPAVQAGKCDFAASGIAITEERKENVYFSRPNIEGDVVIMVKKKAEAGGAGTFFTSIRESFEKTFIREHRYRLFLQGIVVTMIITALSIVFGTLLGFGAYMWCRTGGRFADAVTRFCVWIVQGLPVVVLLMLLYYVVFGKTSLNGMWVAVVGFTLTFGSAVHGMLRSGVNAVESGQTEAAYALGFSDRQTFFGIILPQAAQFFMPAYKGEIVTLIKATAIVGYIAVQDLTKMGDIIRSRTYEAFFPLIAVAVIYFILAGILTMIVSRVTFSIDPKKRTKEQILKGVRLDD